MPALLLILAALVLTACGDTATGARAGGPEASATPRAEEPRRERPRLRQARCPDGLENCAEASGRVIFVEAVDPDGDGDAHYVLAGGDITAPGMSVIDVPVDLRPRRLPRVGDRVSAAGPVFRGSYGQRQIQALEVHHAPRR